MSLKWFWNNFRALSAAEIIWKLSQCFVTMYCNHMWNNFILHVNSLKYIRSPKKVIELGLVTILDTVQFQVDYTCLQGGQVCVILAWKWNKNKIRRKNRASLITMRSLHPQQRHSDIKLQQWRSGYKPGRSGRTSGNDNFGTSPRPGT